MPKKELYQLKLGNTADYVYDFQALHYIKMDEEIEMITGMPASHFKRENIFDSLVKLIQLSHVSAVYDFIQLSLEKFKNGKFRKDMTVNTIYDMVTPGGNRRILDQFRMFQKTGEDRVISIGRFTDISHIEKTGLPQIFILEGNKVVFERRADPMKLAKEEKLPLSTIELKILKLSSRGLTPSEIANKLNLSSATIYSHRKNIRQKMKMEFSAAMNLLQKKEII
jgi:hypothetical protein